MYNENIFVVNIMFIFQYTYLCIYQCHSGPPKYTRGFLSTVGNFSILGSLSQMGKCIIKSLIKREWDI